jgi:hypothetical protein
MLVQGIVFKIDRESAYQEGMDFGDVHIVMGSVSSCPSTVLWLEFEQSDAEFDFANQNRSNRQCSFMSFDNDQGP